MNSVLWKGENSHLNLSFSDESLPKEILMAEFPVKTPAETPSHGKLWRYYDHFYFSNNRQTVPYVFSVDQTIKSDLKVLPNKQLKVSHTAKEKILQVTFIATFKNDLTRDEIMVEGKWIGGIGYTETDTYVKEEPID